MARSSLYALFCSIVPLFAVGQSRVIDLKPLNALIETWKEAHNKKDLVQLQSLYAESVYFYASKESKAKCIGIKSTRLRSSKYFHQEIVTKPRYSVYESGSIKASFVKRVTSGEQTKDWDAYLVFKEEQGRLLITAESDLKTDGDAGFTLDLGRELTNTKVSESQITLSKDLASIDGSRYSSLPIISAIVVIALVSIVIVVLVKRKRAPLVQGGPTISSKKEDDGRKFENFVVDRFNRANREDKKYFNLLIWQSDKIHNGIYPKSSMDPDLLYEFKHNDYKRRFAIECKYKSYLPQNKFQLKKQQLNNYLKFEKEERIPVSIVLGLKGTPHKPEDLYIIPLSRFKNGIEIAYEDFTDCYNSPSEIFFFDIGSGQLKTWKKILPKSS